MRLLVLRTSAMGDVALITPVLKGFREQYPDDKILLVTRRPFGPFFETSDNLQPFFPDFKNRHKGLAGLVRLYRDIRKEGRIDYAIDLHDVIRTRVLRLFLRISGTPIKVIDKGRKEKRSLIKGTKVVQLSHSVEQYNKVFEGAGFKIVLPQGPWMQPEAYFICIPVSQLPCRPCTVYGKGECRRGDHACMKWLTPEVVYRKLIDLRLL